MLELAIMLKEVGLVDAQRHIQLFPFFETIEDLDHSETMKVFSLLKLKKWLLQNLLEI